MSTTIKNGQPVGGDPVVTSTSKKKNGRSTFNLSFSNADTPMFGLCTPFFSEFGVPGDNWKVRSGHKLRTMNLSSPLMQNLTLHKAYFATPMRAILPHTWDLLFKNPVSGNDIDADKASCLISLLSVSELMSSVHYTLFNLDSSNKIVWSSGLSVGDALTALLISYSIGDGCFGPQSLLHRFRIYSGSLVDEDGRDYNSALLQCIKSMLGAIHAAGFEVALATGSSYGEIADVNFDRRRVGGNAYITSTAGVLSFIHWWQENPAPMRVYDTSGEPATIQSLNSSPITMDFPDIELQPSGRLLQFSEVIAYQLGMAEFMTDSKIDPVYSAEMFRNMAESIIYALPKSTGSSVPYDYRFTYHGVEYRYDAFSAVGLRNLIAFCKDAIVAFAWGSGSSFAPIGLLVTLLTTRKCLRYKDYLTGARTNPLAVGDITAEVSGSAVSAIDITKSIVAQRFLNQVNRVGNKTKDYLKGIFGVTPMERNDIPSYLCDVQETIYSQEIENTAEAQEKQANSTTSILRSKGARYLFEFGVKENCIITGIMYFSVRQFYPNTQSWFALNMRGRDTMYNPYFQHIGDQPISLFETGLLPMNVRRDDNPMGDSPVFGYTARDMQYKTRMDVCNGAFGRDHSLYSWLFTLNYNSWLVTDNQRIDSDFIRFSPEEFCEYYNVVSRSENNVENFDFIIINENFVSCSRHMSFNPQIL